MLLGFAPAAMACINTVATDNTGRRFEPEWFVGQEFADWTFGQDRRDSWNREARQTIANARAKPDFAHLTDLGVLLIYQGQYAAAVRHFLFVERRFPGHHETAANLGTALELAGHDAVALRWIRIGIQRNRNEHLGTEWLHARILQAKLAIASDRAYLKGHSVAGVAFEPALVPPMPKAMPPGNDGKPVTAWQLHVALSYQLHERLQFVRPTDPIVANLLQDWATLNLAGGPIENAAVLYEAAVRYGARNDTLMRSRQGYIERTLAQADDDHWGGTCALCQPPDPPPPPDAEGGG